MADIEFIYEIMYSARDRQGKQKRAISSVGRATHLH